MKHFTLHRTLTRIATIQTRSSPTKTCCSACCLQKRRSCAANWKGKGKRRDGLSKSQRELQLHGEQCSRLVLKYKLQVRMGKMMINRHRHRLHIGAKGESRRSNGHSMGQCCNHDMGCD